MNQDKMKADNDNGGITIVPTKLAILDGGEILPHNHTDVTAPLTPTTAAATATLVDSSFGAAVFATLYEMAQDNIFQQEFFIDNPSAEMERCVIFLYVRAFGSGMEQNERIHHIETMVNTPEKRTRILSIFEAEQDKNLLMDDEDNQLAAFQEYETFHVTIWRLFAKYRSRPIWTAFPFWKGGPTKRRSFGFLNDMKHARYFLRPRKTCGNCYLHAPCTFVGYQIQKDMPDLKDYGTVDIAKFACSTLTNKKLWDYVIQETGGSAVKELEELLEGTATTVANISAASVGAALLPSWLEDILAQHGPILVSCFKVSKQFKACASSSIQNQEHGIYRFDGGYTSKGNFLSLPNPVKGEKARIGKLFTKINRKKVIQKTPKPHHKPTHILLQDENTSSGIERGASFDSCEHPVKTVTVNLSGNDSLPISTTNQRHAMLLLGGCVDPDGRTWFILQNWWWNLPLVLVSSDYLLACEAHFAFTETPMRKLPGYSVNKGAMTKSSFHDTSEQHYTTHKPREEGVSETSA